MKHPTSKARTRRVRAGAPKKVRLNLQRRPRRQPSDDFDAAPKSNFWKWVGWVAFAHLVVIALVTIFYEAQPVPVPPEPMISLLPPGDVVKGTAGKQVASKLGPTTTASVAHHSSAPPPTSNPIPVSKPTPLAAAVHPAQVTPKPQPQPPKPITKSDLASVTPPPPKPPAPSPNPKVKVDLTQLEDGPAVDRPAKPKPHPKKIVKAVHHPDELGDDADSTVASSGLSREEIAEKLGAKLGDEGRENAVKMGASGSADGHANSFSDFYNSISEQAHSEWQEMNPTTFPPDSPIRATVQIHVERDGRVPSESVRLLKSSGDAAFDDSAVTAAENLGYLHQPLPEGCPNDISIIFKPQQ